MQQIQQSVYADNLYQNCSFCDLQIYKPNINTHEAACEKAFLEIANSQQVMQQQSFIKLKKNFSGNQEETINCPQCDAKITFMELDSHEQKCENKQILCQFCKDLFPRQLMVLHLEQCLQKIDNPNEQKLMQQQQQQNPSIFPIKEPEQTKQEQQEKPILLDENKNQPQLIPMPFKNQNQTYRIYTPKCQKCCKELQKTYNPYNKIKDFYDKNVISFQCDSCNANVQLNQVSYHCSCFNGGYDLCQACFELKTLQNQNKQNININNNNNQITFQLQKPLKNNIQLKSFPKVQRPFPKPIQQKTVQKQQKPLQKQQKPVNDHFNFEKKEQNEQQYEAMLQKMNEILDKGGDLSQFQLEDHDLTNVGGIKKELKDQLPIIYFDQNQKIMDDENKKCCICMNEFVHKDKLLLLPCTHRFHDDCIGHWISKNPTCPLCHKDITQFMTN